MIKTKKHNIGYFSVVKRIVSSFREYKKYAIIAPIFVGLEVVFECFIPFVIKWLIDDLEKLGLEEVLTDSIAQAAMDSIIKYSLILLPLAIGAMICGLISARLASVASLGLSKNLRHDMYVSIQNFSFENIDKFATAGLVTRITTDVFYTQMAVMSVIRIATRAPLMILASLIISIVLAPSLSWIFLPLIPLLGIGLVLIIKKASPIFEKVFDEYDELNDRIEENIKGIRVVKSYVRSDFEKSLFKKRAGSVADNFVRADKIFALSSPLMQFSVYALVSFLLYFGGTSILNGNTTITTGTLNSIALYGIQTLMNLMMLSMVLINITMSNTSMRRIYEVLKEKPTITNCSNPIYVVNDGSVEFKNVSFKYKKDADRFALDNVNLKINSGETIGIIGGTGSAKTTLVSLISRLYDASEGEVLVSGVNVKDYDLVTLRDKVSVVLQKNVLFSGTIKDNLKWGNDQASDEEVKHAAFLACADEFISSFKDGYNHMIEQGGTNVSGGQKQRLCIARALLKNPKILILDDSTSAVDTKTDARIRKSFKEYIPEVTKFIIAQRVASIEDADRIIVMNDGHIDDIGTHQYLLENNRIYRECYISQTKKGGLE